MKRALIYLVLVFSFGMVLAACENTQEEINALNRRAVQIDSVIKIETYFSQGGITKARLTAPLMRRVTDDTTYTEFPKSLHVDFYNPAQTVESWLDCKYGKYLENVNKVYLRDSVRVISINHDTLLCKDLWWDQNAEKFYTDKEAIYHSPTMPIYQGLNGMEATQDLKKISFKNSKGELMTNGSGGILGR